jgi:hypothetical protein
MGPFRVSPVTGLSSVTWLATVTLLGVVVAGGCSRNSAKDPAQDPNPQRVKTPRLAPGLAPAGTAALIDLDRSPLGALLEAKLLDGAKLAWLERGDIDKILAEQELQALFAPEAGSQRIALGKLLKAHVLVLLRSADNPPGAKHLELVVFETQQGLRLWRQMLEPSKDADADAAALHRVVQEAIAKQAAKITEVCAVPPFVSNDLGYQFDHLKSAYAKILEQQLQRRPGVLLVEIAEAQALSREIALADPAATLERWLPVYFLGDYRNEGIGDKQRVAVRLRVRRGEQELAVVEKTALSPAEAPLELQRMAASLAEKVFGSAQAVLDPEAEAKQLALRADEFDRLGSWPEALAVAEASLLLTPEQPEMRHRAAIACFLLARQHLQRARGNAAEAVQAMTTYRRGLEHQEVYLRPVASRKGAEPVARHSDYRLRTEFSFAAGRFLSYRPDTQKLWELRQEILKEELESVLRLMRARAHAGCDEYHLLDRVVELRPSRERYPSSRTSFWS